MWICFEYVVFEAVF